MAEITKVVVKMGDTEVTLTPEEAKDLYRVLGNLFSEQRWYPYYPITYPVSIPSIWAGTIGQSTATLTCGSSK